MALGTAIATMVEQKIRHLPVVDDVGAVVGIITDRDLRSATLASALEEYLSEGARRRLRRIGATSLRAQWLLNAVVFALACADGAAGAGTVKHSGTVAAVDRAAGTMVLDEVGPWRVKDGVTQITRRTIVVPATTEVTVARRAEEPGGWLPRPFVEAPAGLGDLAPGQFVTVECRPEAARLIAVKVTITVVSGTP
jgi:CBS domain-containing protein